VDFGGQATRPMSAWLTSGYLLIEVLFDENSCKISSINSRTTHNSWLRLWVKKNPSRKSSSSRMTFHLTPTCPRCGQEMTRVHRTLLQRLVYSGVYNCPKCDRRLAAYYPFLDRQTVRCRFVFSLQSHCVTCGTDAVHELCKPDPIDPLSKHLLARVQWLLRAPRKRCPDCRLQYYDWRPITARARQAACGKARGTAAGQG
jgi:predicted RNA-binding Zn-ribbon protein involved in translation (DUF1610 family)